MDGSRTKSVRRDSYRALFSLSDQLFSFFGSSREMVKGDTEVISEIPREVECMCVSFCVFVLVLFVQEGS